MKSDTLASWVHRSATSICSAALRSLALSGFLATLGCGTGGGDSLDRIAVHGTVLLDGQPLPTGTIRFIPAGSTHGPKTAFAITQGRFQASAGSGPCVGSHRVEIELTNDERYAHDDEQALDRLAAQRVRLVERAGLPAIYNERSTLTATIEKEHQPPLEFELSSQ